MRSLFLLGAAVALAAAQYSCNDPSLTVYPPSTTHGSTATINPIAGCFGNYYGRWFYLPPTNTYEVLSTCGAEIQTDMVTEFYSQCNNCGAFVNPVVGTFSCGTDHQGFAARLAPHDGLYAFIRYAVAAIQGPFVLQYGSYCNAPQVYAELPFETIMEITHLPYEPSVVYGELARGWWTRVVVEIPNQKVRVTSCSLNTDMFAVVEAWDYCRTDLSTNGLISSTYSDSGCTGNFGPYQGSAILPGEGDYYVFTRSLFAAFDVIDWNNEYFDVETSNIELTIGSSCTVAQDFKVPFTVSSTISGMRVEYSETTQRWTMGRWYHFYGYSKSLSFTITGTDNVMCEIYTVCPDTEDATPVAVWYDNEWTSDFRFEKSTDYYLFVHTVDMSGAWQAMDEEFILFVGHDSCEDMM